MKTKTLSIFIFQCLLMPLIHAQWTSDSLQNTLVRDTTTEQTVNMIAVTPEGGYTYISWFEMYSGNYQLRMQLLDSNGYKQWPASGLIVSNHPQSSALFVYDLTTDLEGNAIVAFQDERTGSMQVVAYMLDLGGNFLWGPDGIVLTDSLSEGLGPAIGVTAANNVIIAWNANSSNNKYIAFQKITGTGSMPWGSVKQLIDPAGTNKYSRPDILPAGTDDFLLFHVLETGNFPGVTSIMQAQRFDNNGAASWINPVVVSTKSIPFFYFPSPESDGADGLYVCFNASNPVNPAMNDVYVQHMNALGNLWSATGSQASTSTTEHKFDGCLAQVPSGGKLWLAMKVTNSSQGNSGVFVQRFDNAGSVELGPTGAQVYPVSPDYYVPFFISADENGAIILYYFGATNLEKIGGIRINNNVVPVWTPVHTMLSSVASGKLRFSGAMITPSQAVAVWQDTRTDNGGIYAQNLNVNGSTGIITSIPLLRGKEGPCVCTDPGSGPVLMFNALNLQEAVITVVDAGGRLVHFGNYLLHAGMNRVSIPLTHQPPGCYYISWKQDAQLYSLKWVKAP